MNIKWCVPVDSKQNFLSVYPNLLLDFQRCIPSSWDKTHTDQNFTCAHSDPSVMMYTFIFEGWHGKPQEAPKFSQEEEPRPGMFEASSMAGGWEESPGWHLQLPSPGKKHDRYISKLLLCKTEQFAHEPLLYWVHFACMVLSSVYLMCHKPSILQSIQKFIMWVCSVYHQRWCILKHTYPTDTYIYWSILVY